MTTPETHVRDIRDADFDQAVLHRSHQVPVVVDFWAAWCGPCRQLGPVLERLASEANGAWELVKLDTDANPRIATQYRISSIPAVKAFRDGAVVAEFIGALPEPQVRAFLEQLVPSAADVAVQSAVEMERSGYLATAEDRYREALSRNPSHATALAGLTRLLLARGAVEDAAALVGQHPASAELKAVRAQIDLRRAGGDDDHLTLVHAVEADPRNAEAHYALGRALAARAEYARALEHLLTVVKLDRAVDNDGARKAMLDIFTALGDDDERTRHFRTQLGMVLF